MQSIITCFGGKAMVSRCLGVCEAALGEHDTGGKVLHFFKDLATS